MSSFFSVFTGSGGAAAAAAPAADHDIPADYRPFSDSMCGDVEAATGVTDAEYFAAHAEWRQSVETDPMQVVVRDPQGVAKGFGQSYLTCESAPPTKRAIAQNPTARLPTTTTRPQTR